MLKNHNTPRGKIETFWIESECLKNNLLEDPVRRRIDIYIPEGHKSTGLPLLVDLVGFMAGGPAHTNWRNWGENVPERADRLIAEGKMPPVVIAFPDCFTRLGGNQYVESTAMGPWQTFLTEEMLPEIEERYGCGGAGKRGVFGKSSGGYGSFIHGMHFGGDIWNAIASHSGDIGFELMYRTDFCAVLRRLNDFNMSIEAFLNHFENAQKLKDADWHTLMVLAQCASYDPDPSQFFGIRLPADTQTCALIPERWANWQASDPLNIVESPEVQNRLKSLKLFYFDCGNIDQYNLVYGSRQLHTRLEELDISHIYEEFPDNHSSVDYRMDISLPLLAKALST